MTQSAFPAAQPLEEQLVAIRRDLHRNAESGWQEFRTATIIVGALQALGWDVRYGSDVVATDGRLGLPDADALSTALQVAIDRGADPVVVSAMAGGLTGVVGVRRGAETGPVVALRFDIDANSGFEAEGPDHRPVREGFASINRGMHHNCGHDGHAAIGLGLARMVSELRLPSAGEIRLIFQPAEEGLRGAASMVAAGVLDGVDQLLSCHLGVRARSTGEVVAGYDNILASTKLDVTFRGRNAHAGISPHEGRNALLAACVAALSLHGIARHGDGETRVNVGGMQGGESRNTVAGQATMQVEVRGTGEKLNQYMVDETHRIITGAAAIYGVESSVDVVGKAESTSSDDGLRALVGDMARRVDGVDNVVPAADFGGSDDFATMMIAVQSNGGEACYLGIGSDLSHFHHSPLFDFDERALTLGVDVLTRVVARLTTPETADETTP